MACAPDAGPARRVRAGYREELVLRLQAPGGDDVAPESRKNVGRTGMGDVLPFT